MTGYTQVGTEAWQRITREYVQMKEALDLLRPAHHTPYVDEEHQGGNCADVLMHALSRAHKSEAAVQRLREWCARIAAAASGEQSEPVFQARMELVDEVRRLLPEVKP